MWTSNREGSFGFNAPTEVSEDLVAAGAIDPAKVVRSALHNAAFVSGLMLTTDALIAEKTKKEKAAEGGGMGGDHFQTRLAHITSVKAGWPEIGGTVFFYGAPSMGAIRAGKGAARACMSSFMATASVRGDAITQ